MQISLPLAPVDYLVIGHIACDLTPAGPRLGGTAAYAALTARALGLRVGVVTAGEMKYPWRCWMASRLLIREWNTAPPLKTCIPRKVATRSSATLPPTAL